MRSLTLFACSALLLQAEIVDRVAIVVGKQVITELQLDEELRIAAFLNRQAVERNLKERQAASDRLIQQILVKREMDLSHYPLPDEADVDQYLDQVRAQFGADGLFDKKLADYGLSLTTVKEHLVLQLMTLRFIEFRFRPDVDISEADIDARYKQEVSTWKETHSGPVPPLDTLKESITKTLVEERIDEALGTWLEETRKQVNIAYLDKTLI